MEMAVENTTKKLMKTLIYICLITALPVIGFAQNTPISKLKYHPAMKKIDIERYEENKQKNEDGYYVYEFEGENGAMIQQTEGTDQEGDSVYSQMIEYKDSPFTNNSSYYKSGVLKAIDQEFYSHGYGLAIVYDRKGEKRSERRMDKGFEYTIEELAGRIKKEYNKDILKLSEKMSVRIERNPIPLYRVRFPELSKTLIIDGVNGDLLFIFDENGDTIYKKGDSKPETTDDSHRSWTPLID